MMEAQTDYHCQDMLKYKKEAAFCDLAFWGNPAWLDCSRSLLAATAATQLVMYHRISMDMNKVTVAQLMGSVKGVIPNSKLAKYGDYSYNYDYEDMYLTPEDITLIDEQCDSRSPFSSSQSNQDSTQCLKHHKEIETKLRWLKKVKNTLNGLRCITIGKELDSKTSELLKLCLRFTEVASINDTLLDTMESDIPFITDYGQLQKMPISRIELQSIPQPTPETDFSLNVGEVDDLWLRLSSTEVRKWWNEDVKTTFPFNIGSAFNNPLIPLMSINFLRHQQNSKRCNTETINIPRNVQRELLGPLLDAIEEPLPVPANTEFNGTAEKEQVIFPEAHGEWTKRLFPRLPDSNTHPETQQTSIMDVRVKTCEEDAQGNGNLAMPMRFYKSIPPPILTKAMHSVQPAVLHRLPSPYQIHCPARKDTIWTLTGNNITTIHPMAQQVHFQIPPAPMVYIPPSASPKWNNCFPQRMNNVATATGRYSKATLPKLNEHSSKIVTGIQTHLLKPEERNITPRNSLQQIEEVIRKDKCSHLSVENRVTNDLWLKNKLSVQLSNYEPSSTARVQQNGDILRSCNNTFQPLTWDKYTQPTAPSSCHIKSSSQLQIREPIMPVKINHSLVNYPLSPQVIQQAYASNMTHFIHKPRFMGPSASNMKQMPDRAIFERYKSNGIYKASNQGTQKATFTTENLPFIKKYESLNYEDKVEKWLESVNKYIKLDSNANFPGACHVDDAPDVCGEIGYLGRWHKRYTTAKHQNQHKTTKLPHRINNRHEEKLPWNMTKYEKRCAQELLLKHLELLKRSPVKLKRGTDLESKIKFMKKYFAEINLESSFELRSRHQTKKSKLTKQTLKNVKTSRNSAKSMSNQRTEHELGHRTGTKNMRHLGSDFDALSRIFYKNDFKVLTHENPEFNAFPSKRVKLSNSLFLLTNNNPWTHDERTKRAANLQYFDKIMNELFSPTNESRNSKKESQDKSNNLEVVNGWTHFKITIKSVLKDIVSSLDR